MVSDDVTVSGTAVMLKARTGGSFFRKGGELVTFEAEGERLGRTLSGGDGVAYYEYLPEKQGLISIRAKSDDSIDTGVLLVLPEDSAVVLVEVDEALTESPLIPMPRPGSVEALNALMEKYHIVYISKSPIGEHFHRNWLKDNGFPEAPVLGWSRGHVLERISSRGLSILAVVGSTELVEHKKIPSKALCFSFNQEDGKCRVRKWAEVVDKLEK